MFYMYIIVHICFTCSNVLLVVYVVLYAVYAPYACNIYIYIYTNTMPPYSAYHPKHLPLPSNKYCIYIHS